MEKSTISSNSLLKSTTSLQSYLLPSDSNMYSCIMEKRTISQAMLKVSELERIYRDKM